MFERFTDRARRVVVLATHEARTMHHEAMTSGHVLVALMAEEHGIGALVLADFNLGIDEARKQVADLYGPPLDSEPVGHIPFTSRAKKVFELSLREALQLGHNYIGTEHILLGIVREGEDLGAQCLANAGVLTQVRPAVIKKLVEMSAVKQEIHISEHRLGESEHVLTSQEAAEIERRVEIERRIKHAELQLENLREVSHQSSLRLDVPFVVSRYIESLRQTDLYGSTTSEVAQTLIREGIRRAIDTGHISQILVE